MALVFTCVACAPRRVHSRPLLTIQQKTSKLRTRRRRCSIDGSLAATRTETDDACELLASEANTFELIRFAAGVFGLYLATPLLSLVDCSFVGRMCGTAQLAALGPGTALCDSTSYILSCLGVATTNLYASRRAQGHHFAAQRVISDALMLSVVCGIVSGVALCFARTPVLRLFGVEQEVIQPAISYISVRAAGAPLALLTTVAQSACLGERDSVSPVIAVAISSIANVLGDALLVPKFGAAGAALATVFAQGIGALFLLIVLRRRQLQLGWCADIVGPLGMPMRGAPSLFTWPSPRARGEFFRLAVPVLVALLGKMVFMNSLVLAAAGLGTTALAAHQVTFQIWVLFCRAGDSLGATAQAYLPSALAVKDYAPRRSLIIRLAKVSVVWGVLNSAVAACVPALAGGVFTKDLNVRLAVQGVAPCLAVGLVLHCATLMLEGVLLASRRGQWLAKVYWLNSLVFTSGLYTIGRYYSSLYVVWGAMVVFQVVRILEFSSRVIGDHWRKPRTVRELVMQGSD